MSSYRLSIGILAHNEAERIGETLATLFDQDIFQRYSVEVIVVANGCTDDTVSAAQKLIVGSRHVWSRLGSARVEELAIGGKANAWNTFVHTLSSATATVLVLMDADIRIQQTNTLSSMVDTLERNAEAVVCVDRPVKDITSLPDRTLLQRLLIAATPEMSSDDVGLCGQLYCAYRRYLKSIMLPTAIAGEDGFLRALLLTDGFTHQENPKRIVRDDSASHTFEAVGSIKELFKHEKWLIACSIVNMILFERFWKEARPDLSAMTLMDNWNRQDTNWLQHYIDSEVKARGWRLLPRQWWFRRWSRLKDMHFFNAVTMLPITALASVADAIIFTGAIRDVRQGRAFRYWGRT